MEKKSIKVAYQERKCAEKNNTRGFNAPKILSNVMKLCLYNIMKLCL